MSKLSSAIRSFRCLPTWVQIWVGLLTLANAASFLLLDTVVGQATAIAAIFVVMTNGPIIWHYGGMNRAMSIPHLFAWIPLQIFIVQQLFLQSDVSVSPMEYQFGLSILVINGISLAFDVVDSWRWLRGERETPGVTS